MLCAPFFSVGIEVLLLSLCAPQFLIVGIVTVRCAHRNFFYRGDWFLLFFPD